MNIIFSQDGSFNIVGFHAAGMPAFRVENVEVQKVYERDRGREKEGEREDSHAGKKKTMT